MSTYKQLTGGVAAPLGFTAGGIYCGVKRAGYPTNTVTAASIVANEPLQAEHKPDLAMIVSEVPCTAAAVFTQNLVQGAPIAVCRENLAKGKIRAVTANSGNANTCNADGVEKARAMCKLTAAARAIMTTDTVVKQAALSFELDGKTVTLGAMSKGSGMIHPNMATMLAFVTTDAAISTEMLDKALREAVGDSFNMLSVDGDTSTNDTLCILASGLAGNEEITAAGEGYDLFAGALRSICMTLARMMAKDGEGATKLVECVVTGAQDTAAAKTAAKSVICSPLLKSAMFGCDANWGRILCALGYSGAPMNVNAIDVAFRSAAGYIRVCEMGSGIPFSEDDAKRILSEDEILIEVTLRDGEGKAAAFGCDLTYDYVKINGDYRT